MRQKPISFFRKLKEERSKEKVAGQPGRKGVRMVIGEDSNISFITDSLPLPGKKGKDRQREKWSKRTGGETRGREATRPT